MVQFCERLGKEGGGWEGQEFEKVKVGINKINIFSVNIAQVIFSVKSNLTDRTFQTYFSQECQFNSIIVFKDLAKIDDYLDKMCPVEINQQKKIYDFF